MSEVAHKFDARRLLRAGQTMLRNFEHDWHKHHVRELLWEAQDGLCLCCETRLQSRYRHPRDGDRDTIDHVYPKGPGGNDKLGNLALMHHKCNAKKAQRPPTPGEVSRLLDINLKLGWPNPY